MMQTHFEWQRIELDKDNERVQQNVDECWTEDGFDWKIYQYLCDIADYWDSED